MNENLYNDNSIKFEIITVNNIKRNTRKIQIERNMFLEQDVKKHYISTNIFYVRGTRYNVYKYVALLIASHFSYIHYSIMST